MVDQWAKPPEMSTYYPQSIPARGAFCAYLYRAYIVLNEGKRVTKLPSEITGQLF